MQKYSPWRPWHWVMALFSNSRKVQYVPPFPNDISAKCGNKGYKYEATIRACYWWRNIGHDFTHYIVGFTDQEDDSRTVEGFSTVWGNAVDTNVPGLIVALRRYKWMFFPYLAYWGHGVKSYFGWRPDGSLGFKIRRG